MAHLAPKRLVVSWIRPGLRPLVAGPVAEPANGGSPPRENLTFEQAYAELEQTATALQQGQLSVDGTLRLYERGSFLARFCLEKLDGVELKVSQLLSHG